MGSYHPSRSQSKTKHNKAIIEQKIKYPSCVRVSVTSGWHSPPAVRPISPFGPLDDLCFPSPTPSPLLPVCVCDSLFIIQRILLQLTVPLYKEKKKKYKERAIVGVRPRRWISLARSSSSLNKKIKRLSWSVVVSHPSPPPLDAHVTVLRHYMSITLPYIVAH